MALMKLKERIEEKILERPKFWAIAIGSIDLILFFLGFFILWDRNNPFNFLMFVLVLTIFTGWPIVLILSQRK